jgi:hypothetical protein
MLCAAAATMTAAATTVPGAGAHPATHALTLHLVEKSFGFNFVDNPPRQGRNEPPLIGDTFAFTSDLLTRGGQHAGHLEVTCTVTRGGMNGYSACSGIMALAGGQLALMALAPTGSDAAVTEIAIVGGTGAYEGATGSVRSVSRGNNSRFSEDTLHVILP